VYTDALLLAAGNLSSLILTLYGGNVLNSILSSIAYILDEKHVRLNIKPTTDGRAFLTLTMGNLDLSPPFVSDGVLKMLAMEIAINQGAPLLVVDEIENSLHVKAVHRLLDDIRSSNTALIATTHSPAIIDVAKPEGIVILERRGAETVASRIRDPERLFNKLKELGVTLSEYLAYIEL